ncbi:MAG: D-alanyl-D-alanine carboxypeptidase/D-alanyl-D-alanine-endopeptidase [Actinobacteria bacterium]|nr:D-alanyl-D-alanine carboxypeptidase/D-alanyl-D-alanine-endopeptidase [Actinomycetota bacterium]
MPVATPDTGADTACRTIVVMRFPGRRPLVGALTISIALTTLLTAGPASARPTAPTDPVVDSLLQQRLTNPRVGSDVGLIVIDAATGAVVSSHGGDALMLPASNMKIITAVDVLATLGANARFTTRVRSGATPGDIVLEGGGDPLLSSSDLQELASQAAKQLPRGTKILVHVDADLFPVPGRGPGWTKEYLPYVAAPVVPLARLGDYSPDPSTNAARVFTQRLRTLGVKARLAEPADAGPNSAVLAQFSDNTVADAVSLMLSRSENNVAEVLYRQVAVASGLEPSWEGARAAAEATLTKLGIDPAGMSLLDGSGLSRKNRVSPRFLAEVLRLARVTRPERFTDIFDADALPVSGQTGTLATAYGRYVTKQARCARGDVHAKTGSLFDTIALSGLAETTGGDERLFSILVNDRPQRYSALSIRQVLDGLTATITGCWN